MKCTALSLGIILSLILSIFFVPISTHAMPSEPHATIVRTTVFKQITNFTDDVNTYQYYLPQISADGSRIVFNRQDTDRAAVINFDGTGLTDVDTMAGRVDLSANGSKVIVSDGTELHIVNADGTGKTTLIALGGPALTETAISGDGTTVFLIINVDTTYNSGTPIGRGLWAIQANGTGLRQVVSPAQVAALIGVTAADISPFWSYAESFLDVSSDGSKVVLTVSRNTSTHDYLFAVNGDGSNLRQFGPANAYSLRNVSISGDGTKIGYELWQTNPGPWELGVYNFDSTGKVVLASGDSQPFGYNSPMSMTSDGSKLMKDGAALVYNTDGSGIWPLAMRINGSADYTLVHAATDYGTMSGDGTRFAFLYYDTGHLWQLATAQITDAMGQGPTITNPSITPANILNTGSSKINLQANVTVPAGSTITQVGGALQAYQGMPNTRFTDLAMSNTSGSNYAYNDWVNPQPGYTIEGRQVVRVVAESLLGGVRHATQVEFEPFAIVSQLPGKTYTVSGQTKNSSGSPLPGVIISSSSGANATSGADGSYTLSDLITGTHTLNAALAGYVFSSAVVTVPPDVTGQNFTGYALTPPTNLEAHAGVNSIALEWVPSANPAVTGYNVYRSSSANGSFSKITTSPVTGDTWTDSDAALLKDTTYYYYLKSVAGNAESVPSNTASAKLGTVTLSIPYIKGPHGQNATVPVNIENANGMAICAMDVFVSYTPATLTISDVQRTILTLEYSFAENIVEPGVVKISLASAECGDLLYGPGTLFNLIFTVPGAVGATSPLTFDVVKTDLYVNEDFINKVPLNLVNGLFTVQPAFVLGDLNGDGVVTSADAAIALQLAVEKRPPYPPSTEQAVAGDVNGDGRINSADAALIMRIAAGLPLIPAKAAVVAPLQGLAPVNMTIPNRNAGRGQALALPVQISSAAGVAGADLIVNFEPSVLIVTGVQSTALTSNFNVQWNVATPGALHISLSPKAGYEGGLSSGSGDFVTINFAVSSTAPLGSKSPVTLAAVRLSDTYSRNYKTSALQTDVTVQNGVMTITKVTSWTIYMPVIKKK